MKCKHAYKVETTKGNDRKRTVPRENGACGVRRRGYGVQTCSSAVKFYVAPVQVDLRPCPRSSRTNELRTSALACPLRRLSWLMHCLLACFAMGLGFLCTCARALRRKRLWLHCGLGCTPSVGRCPLYIPIYILSIRLSMSMAVADVQQPASHQIRALGKQGPIT